MAEEVKLNIRTTVNEMTSDLDISYSVKETIRNLVRDIAQHFKINAVEDLLVKLITVDDPGAYFIISMITSQNHNQIINVLYKKCRHVFLVFTDGVTIHKDYFNKTLEELELEQNDKLIVRDTCDDGEEDK